MFKKLSILGAIAMATGAGFVGWWKRPNALDDIPESKTKGAARRGGGTVAQAKRAAIKVRNRERNRAAHRG